MERTIQTSSSTKAFVRTFLAAILPLLLLPVDTRSQDVSRQLVEQQMAVERSLLLSVTSAATAITAETAMLNGTITLDGMLTKAWFEVGTDSSLLSFTATPQQSLGLLNTALGVSQTLEGLEAGMRYYYRAAASNVKLTVRGLVMSFITVPAPPVLVVPMNQETGVQTIPSLFWEASRGAASYNLQVSESPAFESFAINQSGITTTSFPASGLNSGTVYFWRLSASNESGTSVFSAPSSFTTLATNLLPRSPLLLTPLDGTTKISNNPTLTWSAVQGATAYHVEISRNAAFATLVVDAIGVTDTSFSVSGLANNTLYFWRVHSVLDSVEGPYSATWSFKTIVALPAMPLLALPQHGATRMPTSPLLEWSEAERAESYHVQMSIDALFATTVVDADEVEATRFVVEGLANNTLYFWRISAQNEGGESPFSPIWSFTTIAALPVIPSLAQPLDGALRVSIDPTLRWSEVAGAMSYQVQIATSPLFTTTDVEVKDITETALVLKDLRNNARYFWRVSAMNEGGESPFSAAWSFITIAALPASPSIIFPPDGATRVSTSTKLQWVEVIEAKYYRVQVSLDDAFATLTVDSDSVAGTSLEITGLANSTLYYWRVRARNEAGESPYSGARSFKTVGALPGIPLLASPPDGATGISIAPTLNWNKVESASFYRVQVSADQEFATTIVDADSLVETSLAIHGLAHNALFYWRVSSTNAEGTSPLSPSYKFTTTGTTSVEQSSTEAMLMLNLRQNYPNPFNPSTTLEFTLPDDGHVVLKILDVLGRELTVLFDETAQAGKVQRVYFDGIDLPSGTYYAQLQYGTKQLTRKLLLLK